MKSRCITRNRAIPFSLDRGSKVSLTRQVEAGFKRAILTGRYKAGDVLPPRDELAAMLGVSEIVSREAVRRLVAEGYVRSRPRIGSVVLARDVPHWRGRVLLVGANGDGGYYFGALGQELRLRLLKAGYMVADATVLWKSNGVYDPSGLDLLLKEPLDMAVVITSFMAVMRQLDAAGVPFAIVSDKDFGRLPAQCEAQFRMGQVEAVREMMRACKGSGIRKATEVWTWSEKKKDAAEFRRAGIEVESWRIAPIDPDNGYIEAVQRGALMAFEERLAKEGTAWLPDLLYFRDDDHLAAGALSALLHHGVDVPRDVRVVTLANRGLGPVFHRPLARLEVDPVVHANVIADYVLARLGGAVDLPVPSLPMNFIPGETLRL